jgi:adenine-specific DNA-methyltransferase
MPAKSRLPKKRLEVMKQKPLMKTGSVSLRHEGPTMFYPLYVQDNTVIRIGEPPPLDFHPESRQRLCDDGTIEIWPIDSIGTERKWRYNPSSLAKVIEDLEIRNGKNDFLVPYLGKKAEAYKTVWSDADYNAAEYGSTLLKKMFGRDIGRLYPKSLHTEMDCIYIGLQEQQGLVLDFFAGSGTTGHAVIALNSEEFTEEFQEMGTRKYILVEMGEYFDSVLLPRLKKAVFSAEWKEGKPVGNGGISHLLKYHTLEQYEDSLNSIAFPREADGQAALDMYGDDYLLRYLLDFETEGSASLLDLEQMAEPFAYTLQIKRNGASPEKQPIDLPETFAYLLGLTVIRWREYRDGERLYRALLGEERSGKRVAVVWRSTTEMAEDEAALSRDRQFLTETVLPALVGSGPPYDRLFLNGGWTVPGAESIEPEFHRLMFAGVG